MGANDLLGLIPTMQATALLAENFKELKSKKKKPVKLAVKNIVGAELIKITAQNSSI